MKRIFRLGIIGPCAAIQPWIPIPAIYHRKLYWMLRKNNNIHLDVKIAPMSTEDFLPRFLSLEPLDGVVIHLQEIASRSILFVRKTTSFHPFLFRRTKTGWRSTSFHREGIENDPLIPFYKGNLDYHERSIEQRTILGKSLHEWNVSLGCLAGLHRWALRDEMRSFDELIQVCRQKGISVYVLGPTPRGNGSVDLKLWQWMNRVLSKRLTMRGIPHFLFEKLRDEEGHSYLKADGYHWNQRGHLCAAEGIYQMLVKNEGQCHPPRL